MNDRPDAAELQQMMFQHLCANVPMIAQAVERRGDFLDAAQFWFLISHPAAAEALDALLGDKLEQRMHEFYLKLRSLDEGGAL